MSRISFDRYHVRVVLSFLVACFLIFNMTHCGSKQSEKLPVLGVLPNFELTNQDQKKVSLSDYQNKVWVANFIFTSCAGTCPRLTQKMTNVQNIILQEAGKDPNCPYRIVSFSVDPERDSPEALKAYGKRFKVNFDYWNFLTGPYEQVKDTVVKGFKISMAKVPNKSQEDIEAISDFSVVHGEKFVLIDQKGQIRGYYDADSKGIRQLVADMKRL